MSQSISLKTSNHRFDMQLHSAIHFARMAVNATAHLQDVSRFTSSGNVMLFVLGTKVASRSPAALCSTPCISGFVSAASIRPSLSFVMKKFFGLKSSIVLAWRTHAVGTRGHPWIKRIELSYKKKIRS